MDPSLYALTVVALVILGTVVLARKFPVLFRMGARNALRRKAQTAVVVAGLMMGTAIISGSLASGDSLEFGIKKAALDALGPADVLLETDGQLHYPRALYDDLAANRSVTGIVTGLSPVLYEEAAVTKTANHQSEPRVSLIGIDPALNKPFGTFRATDGRALDASELGPNDVYVLDSLAKKLDARAGDTLAVHYSKPITPRIPKLYTYNGNLTASAGVCPLPQVPQSCQYVAALGQAATFQVPVNPGAVSITTLVAWFGPNADHTDIDQTLTTPDGTLYANTNGTPAQPDNPSFLNVSGPSSLASGNWTWSVGAKVAANQPFRAIALVFYEEYNLTALQDFAKQAGSSGFDASQFAGDSTGNGAGGETADLTIVAVVKTDGFGGFLLGQNVFARYDTVARLYGQEDKVDIILVSADANAQDGLAKTPALMGLLPKAVNASADAHPDMPAIRAVKALAVKQRFIDASERAGTLFKEFLTTIGSFTVIAGMMLIVNIFVMLAEERKSELGMARAVGLARRQLIYLFGFEGTLYALAASAIGAVLGLGIAWGLIFGFNKAFTSGPSGNAGRLLTIPFHFEWSSVAWAFAAGFMITMITVAIASWRVSRLNIVRAIRRIEEPPKPASRALFWSGAVLFLGGSVWALYGFVMGDFPSKILAPCVALMGAGIVATRFVASRIAYPLAGAGVAAYAGFTIFTFGNPKGMLNAVMGPIRGLFIVLAVVLIIIHVPQLVRLTSAILIRFRGLIPAVRPGVAYPLGKKTRTGLTTTMFALVILVVVAFSIFGATFTVDTKAQSGGYDVEGDTTVPIGDLQAIYAQQADPSQPDPFDRVAYHDDLRYAIAFGGRSIRIDNESIHYQGPPADYIYSYNEGFAKNNRYDFIELDARYHSNREAYEAVLNDPSLTIISVALNFDEEGNPGLHHVGDTLTLQTPSGTASFRIIGIQKQLYLGGLFVNPQVLDSTFQRIRGDYLFKLNDGEDPIVAAREIEAAFEKQGMDANSIEQQAQQQLEQNKRFLTLFQLFLGFGLVVGIASLGIVTARSVIERRQEIGMLRAIGYPRKQVLRIFYIEIFFTTTLGILVGGAIGVITSYGVVVSTPALASLGVKFTIPWLDLAEIIALVYAAVFLATYWPARQGSNVPPAEAVRYIE
ncbi:MAG: FtsX-like permease family protein [Candidatus Thermoplasmatota archaeon]